MNDDITQSILRGIREDLQANARQAEADRQAVQNELRLFRAESNQRFEAMNQRFEVIEHTLKDMSEQLLFHSRALRSLLETRPHTEDRLTSIELTRLEGSGR
ncbi:MAG: hypothetical protein SFW67_11625 [Myxococcaceae bacterium]|nr:hypothetical protein [Myxococcaceae bacterium]